MPSLERNDSGVQKVCNGTGRMKTIIDAVVSVGTPIADSVLGSIPQRARSRLAPDTKGESCLGHRTQRIQSVHELATNMNQHFF